MTDSHSTTVRDNQTGWKDLDWPKPERIVSRAQARTARAALNGDQTTYQSPNLVAMKMPSGNCWRNQVPEPDALKGACPVLRGGCGSDAASLPD
jgi:hypothetical protein